MEKILIINGPNLNLLGKREPEVYGTTSFESFFEDLKQKYAKSVQLFYFQSNHEGDLVDKIHETGFDFDGIIINAGALTHTSLSISDAIKAVNTPVIEVHISNTHKRESFRHHSFLSSAVQGVILGFGMDSYRLAIEAFLKEN